jgi:hypothetical protein
VGTCFLYYQAPVCAQLRSFRKAWNLQVLRLAGCLSCAKPHRHRHRVDHADGVSYFGSCQGFVQRTKSVFVESARQASAFVKSVRYASAFAVDNGICEHVGQLCSSKGLSAVELALLLSLLMPLTLAGTSGVLDLHRSLATRRNREHLAAARYVSNIEPSSLIRSRIDR